MSLVVTQAKGCFLLSNQKMKRNHLRTERDGQTEIDSKCDESAEKRFEIGNLSADRQ